MSGITRRTNAAATEEAPVPNSAEAEAARDDGPAASSQSASASRRVPLKGWRFVVKKLITKEDPVMLHKVLGLLSLVSFVYRYGYMYNTRGNLGFDGTLIDWATMLLHTALSTSSLIFHVLKARILRKPYIIWEEYRLHAISFTLRCLTVFVLGYVGCSRFVLFPGVMVWHVIADKISARHGMRNTKTGGILTTVRGTDKIKGGMRLLTRFYAFYQFSAIASHLIPSDRTMDMGFNTLIAIQSSAFLMTLFRKNLITYSFHGIGYTLCLVLSGFHIFRVHTSVYFLGGLLAVFTTRVTYGVNKYHLWCMFALAAAAPDLMAMAQERHVVARLDGSGYAPFNASNAAAVGQQYLDLGQLYLSAGNATLGGIMTAGQGKMVTAGLQWWWQYSLGKMITAGLQYMPGMPDVLQGIPDAAYAYSLRIPAEMKQFPSHGPSGFQ